MLRRIEQHPNSVAQQVDCGFEAGGQHQARECLQLVGVEAGTVVGGLDDLAHQIVAGVAAQLLQMVGQPAVEADDALIDLLVLLPRQPDVEAGRAQLAEVQDAWPVFVGDAEDVADDGDRKLRAVAVDDVDDVGVALEFVEQRGRGLLDPLPQCRNGSRGEHRRHHLAVPGVIGRFDRQQRWWPERVQQSGVGLLGDPAQRPGQIAALLA